MILRPPTPLDPEDDVAEQEAPTLTPPPGLLAAVLPGACAEFALIAWPTRGPPPGIALTAAEREVVRLVAAGRSNAEIGRFRGTSARTIANQLANLFRKTGLRSRYELVAAFGGGEREDVPPPAPGHDPDGSGR
jgi:DNA-binding CsgD family transcriptional regulator